MRSLVRSQLRLAAGVLGLVVAPAGRAAPGLRRRARRSARSSCSGLPLPWLLLAVVVYPVVVVAGWWYSRRAERAEREFTELVEGT